MAITQSTSPDVQDDVDERDRRAAEDPMVVVKVAPNLFAVYSGEQKQYTVSVDPMACTCDDWHYREPEDGCKHIRRVRQTLGIDDIPEGVAVDWTLPKQLEKGL